MSKGYTIIKNSLLPSENPITTLVPATATNNDYYYLNYNITIGQSFEPIYAVENPIYFLLNSAVSGSSETFPQISFRVNSVPVTGTTITLSGTNVGDFPTYLLTSAKEPKFNQFYASTTVPARTTAEVADSIVFGLNENFAFRQRFYASRNASDIVVKSLTKGSRFNIDFLSSSGNISLLSTTDSSDNYRGEALKDFKLWCDLYINSSGDFGSTLNRANSTRVSQYEDLWSTDNKNYFGLNGVLKNFVSTPLPSGTTLFQALDGSLVNGYLVFGEKYDEFRNNFNRKFLVGQSSVFWAINSSLGFLSENDFEHYTINNDDIINIGTGTVPSALTLAPNPKQTRENQKEFITILYHNSPEISSFTRNFYVQVRAEYYDGSFSSEQIYSSTNITSGNTYNVNVSPNSVGIQALNYTNKVKRYTVRLCCSSNQYEAEVQLLSKSYTYDSTCESRYPVNLIFLNSLGGWDSWLFNGDTEISSDRKIAEFTSPVDFIPNIQDEVTQLTNIEFNKVYKANSGLIDLEHYTWLSTEISKSTNVRLINSDGEYEYIIITKINDKINSDDDLFAFEIEYKKTVDENYIKK